MHLVSVSPSQVTWAAPAAPAAATTFREFASSPHALRGFCSACGSSLTWRSTSSPNEIDVFTGSIDRQALDENLLLAVPQEQYFYANVIEGVTDGVQGGNKWMALKDGAVWQPKAGAGAGAGGMGSCTNSST